MLLKITVPQNMRNAQLLRQSQIPCLCYIGRDFEVHLTQPLDSTVGKVEDWSESEIAVRAPAGGGGKWTHVKHARITLGAVAEGVYEIIELSMFYEAYGWLPVISQSEYATPAPGLWDEE